ncbi:serine/threonine-protein kinase fhke-related [Anaeramoeba flamelloides]|uniref:Serine/threonine-protein kinase fhke-related n=1 Tax=Anaeramoeba flamelloides TaxID=1746091 RepID=A0ABQ8Z9K6_9EUKA|nr:serine/threonine-protein kinase fhke-related [Anaeramoeba flamelloides]
MKKSKNKKKNEEAIPLTADQSLKTGFVPRMYNTQETILQALKLEQKMNEKKKKRKKKNNLDFKITITKPKKNCYKVFVLIFSTLLLISGVIAGIYLMVNRDQRSSLDDHHGIGKLGIKCPNNTDFNRYSIANSFGCCSFFSYTCGRSPTCTQKRDYNSILSGRSTSCDDQLGLLSCSPLSPYVDYFAPGIRVGDDRQNINICSQFCEDLFHSCSSAEFDCSFYNPFPHHNCGSRVDVIYSDSLSFCKNALLLSVNKPKRVRKPKKEKKPWGKLISLTNGIDDLELIRPRYRVGRGNICAISINDEKISKFHCELSIFRDRKNKTKEGEIKTSMWIKDTSTNGVFVNSQPVGKNQKRELFHFDEITFIQPKVNGSAFPKYRFIIHDANGSPPLSCESELLEHYKVISPIQEGIYGRIYLGVDLKNDEKVAIKQVPKNKFYTNTKEKISLSSDKILNYNEILVLEQLKHKSIIELKNVIQTDNTVYIIMEYLSSGDLFNKIKEKQFYEENEARILFKNLIESIIYLHNKNIVHRDLKPENILISNPNSDTDITICDFGIAKSIQEGEGMETRIGTIHYRAPETFTGGGKYTNSCDLWSAGVILYILLSGEMPFHEKRNLALHKQIIRGDFDFSPERFSNISKAAKNLIRRLIRIEPELRLTAKQTLEHPWVIEKPELIEYENDGLVEFIY